MYYITCSQELPPVRNERVHSLGSLVRRGHAGYQELGDFDVSLGRRGVHPGFPGLAHELDPAQIGDTHGWRCHAGAA